MLHAVPQGALRRKAYNLGLLDTMCNHRHLRGSLTVLTSVRTAGKRFERHAYAAAVAVRPQVTLIPSSMAAPAVQDGDTVIY